MQLTRSYAFFHFPLIVFVSLSLFALTLYFFCISLLFVSTKDKDSYQQLVEIAAPTNVESQINPYSAKQMRVGVQKDILFAQGTERLQIRLTSTEAVLVLDHTEEGTEIVEHMKNVKCFMQEELYYLLQDGREAIQHENGKLLIKNGDPKDDKSWIDRAQKGIKPMQYLRYLEADAAIYHYKTDKFYAENVKVSRYSLPGHILLTSLIGFKPTMRGVAHHVEFSFSGNDLKFKANQLKASFYGPGRPL